MLLRVPRSPLFWGSANFSLFVCMNFWRDKSLRIQGISFLTLLSIGLIAEYFLIRYTLNSLTEAERKIDFARSVQVENQEIALLTTLYLQGKKDVGTDLASAIDQQDHLLAVIAEGGRIDGTDQFLEPLSRLPRITLDNLLVNWNAYKSAVNKIIAEQRINQQATVAITDSLGESVAIPASTTVLEANTTTEKFISESRMLSLSRWYNTLITDLEDEVVQKQSLVLNWFSFLILLDVGGLFLIYYAFNWNVLKPLKLLEDNTASKTQLSNFSKNEIGAVALKINDTIEDLRDATNFVIAIGEGKLDLDYKSLDNHYTTGKNKLADSLIEMQSRLKAMSEEERKRQWSNEGLARFVDILRSSNDNITQLGDSVLAALVKYTNSNQGGLYTLNDEDANHKHLELISLFAFDIKKYEHQKVKLGEGILGQAFLEKETTYLNTLPESYIRITSGLGDANPRSVLMVPLKVDTQVYGIIELASFNEYQPHEIAFVEKLGESIASTLASVRAAHKNRELIQQFQQQTEEMRAQEEMMRQNMEELQATQEEISRKEKSYLERIKELESQTSSMLSPAERQSLSARAERKERELLSEIEELKLRLAQKPAQGDDWELAQEVEKTLKINLQALQITQEEMDRKLRQ